MEKRNFSDEQAKHYVKIGLECLGYTEVCSITTCFLDNGEPSYSAYVIGSRKYYGKNQKILKELSLHDFLQLLIFGMVVSGYDLKSIHPVIRPNHVTYQAYINLATYDISSKKTKRR